jgi:membrane protease YdiL (CAAX protease family)
MSFSDVFINPEKRRLRSGWRVAVFLLLSPALFVLLQAVAVRLAREGLPADGPRFDVGAAMIAGYAVQVVWLLLDSWFCLAKLDRLSFAALGLAFYRGWLRDVLLGCAVAALMMAAVVALQMLGGGTRLMLNPLMWTSGDGGGRAVDFVGVGIVAGKVGVVLLFLVLAGAFEEILFRGYPFQTLLRDLPPAVPVALFSLFFGVMHLDNPSGTFFSTANTVLAGVWLAVAYLKTRALWFPTGLHFMWNWAMGAFFGLPVSGYQFTTSPVFVSTSEGPLWLTGGDYGPEGGAAATIVLAAATIVVWRARWLGVSPEMAAALNPPAATQGSSISLGLRPTEGEALKESRE